MLHTLHISSNATKWTSASKVASAESYNALFTNRSMVCIYLINFSYYFALIKSLLHNGEKRINKKIRYKCGFDYFRVILIIAFVLATIT